MNKLEILQQIFQLCVIPLLGILTTYLVKYIQIKSEEIQFVKNTELTEKYKRMLTETITDCVIATNQTYVDSLKNQNAFTKEAQEEAFKRTSETILQILSEEAQEYLTAAYGDLNKFITTQIEATVNVEKK